MLMGVNEGSLFIPKPSDWSRDLFDSGIWEGGNVSPTGSDPYLGDFNFTMDGKPRKYPSGQSSLKLQIEGSRSAARAGVYNVTYDPPGMTVTYEVGQGGSVAQAFSNGNGKLNIPEQAFTGGNVLGKLVFSGSQSLFSTNGLSVSITKDGETETGVYHSEAVAARAALGKIIRFMTARNVNSDWLGISSNGKQFGKRTSATLWNGQTSIGRVSIEKCIDLVKKVQGHLWLAVSHLDDATAIAAEAQAFANSDLPLSTAVFLEFSNELWNTFFIQTRHGRGYAIQEGYGPASGTVGNAVPEPNCIVNVNGNAWPSIGNTTLYPVALGERIVVSVNGVGYLTFEALDNNAAGATIPNVTGEGNNTPDGKWKLIYDNGSNVRAYNRWIAARSMAIWSIWDPILTAAGRPRSVHTLCFQSANGFTGGLIDQPRDIMTMITDAGGVTDLVAGAPYLGGGPVGATGPNGDRAPDMGDYTYNYPNAGWGLVDKDLAGTDFQAYTDRFINAAYGSADAQHDIYAKIASDVSAYDVTKGRPAGITKIGIYEFNSHVILSKYANSPNATAAAANLNAGYANILRSAPYADVMSYYVGKMAAIGGYMCLFDQFGTMPTSYNNNGTVQFGFQEEQHLRPGRFLAAAEFNASPLPSLPPKPVLSGAPTISPSSGTAGSTTFTASDPTATNATSYSYDWFLNGVYIGRGTSVTPASAGTLTRKITARGKGGIDRQTSAGVTVS